MLAAAMPLVVLSNSQLGTIGGSLVHADPAAELPAVSLLLGGEFLLKSKSGARLVAAADFLGYLTPPARGVAHGNSFAQMARRRAWAVLEIARRKVISLSPVALRATSDGANVLQNARIVMFGVGGKPQRMERAKRS